jgi:hypothetical protein
MMKYFQILSVILFLYSCNQSDNSKQKVEESTVKEKEQQNSADNTQAPTESAEISPDMMNKWITETCGLGYTVTTDDLKNANFKSVNNYSTPASRALKTKLSETIDEFKKIKPKVSVSPSAITLSCSDESGGGSGTYFFMENKFAFTGQYGGSGAESFMYDLTTSKLESLPYTIWEINNGIASIEKDYLDPRGAEHPDYEGHIYEKGKLDLATNKITWEKRK